MTTNDHLTTDAEIQSLKIERTILRTALWRLTQDCIASDFNEHWESFKNAEDTLNQIEP